jgi:heme a synthase
MKATYHSGIHKFSVFLVLWTIFLFVFGALVTSEGAALSVPDWPLSFHRFFPDMSGGVFYEHSHRVIAGVMAVCTLILAILIWAQEERRWLRWFAGIAVAGVLVQAIIGGQVVLQFLHYWLPVIHACFGQIVFAAVLSIAVFTSRWWVSEHQPVEDSGAPPMHSVAITNAAVIFLQVILGAGFRHFEIPIWPHVVGAFVVLGVVIWTAIVMRRRFAASRELSEARVLLHAIVGTQFLLGIAAYWSRMMNATVMRPLPVMVTLTVIHTVLGAILFAFAVLIVLLCYRLIPRHGQRHAAGHSSLEKGSVAI